MKNVGLLVILIAVTIGFTQTPDTLWIKTYGGAGPDVGNSVDQTTDGGYIIGGTTGSYGILYDIWLIKTDADGDTLWTKTYGGTLIEDGNSVQQTTDGGYIIGGTTLSYGAGWEDIWLIKTDANGDTLWTKTYGGIHDDYGNSVQQTTDGGYIIVGGTRLFAAGYLDVYLIKTDADGDTLWTKTYGGAYYDQGNSVQQTTDGGYIITGLTESYGAGLYDIWLIKTAADGDTLWTKTYGGAYYDQGNSVQQTSDDGYIIVGNYSLGPTDRTVWLLKTDANGDTLWTKTYGGASSEWGNSVQQTTDDGYIIVGETYSFGAGYTDAYLIKTDFLGDTIWTKTFGGADGDGGNSVQQTTDGGYVVTGGTASFGAGLSDVWIIKTEPDVGVEEPESPVITDERFATTIICGPLQLPDGKKCKVYDITGRAVQLKRMKPGVYFIEIDGVGTQKVVKVR